MLELRKYGWIVAMSLLLGGFLSACKDLSNPIGDDKKLQNDEEIRAYLSRKGISAQRTEEGLYYKIIEKGAGAPKPEVGAEIRIEYVARRLDDVIVDSSEVSLRKPVRAVFGISQFAYYTGQPIFTDPAMALIFGTLLSEGDSAILFVPAHLGSSSAGSLLLPAYSPVRIDLKVVSVRSEKDQIDAFVRENNILITETTESGLRFGKTLSQPDSVALKAGDKVLVKYTGRYLNNTIFDSGTLTETIGGTGSVKGFAEGIAKLRVGEKANLVFPSSLGYGQGDRQRGIPGFAPLYFQVEVLSRTK